MEISFKIRIEKNQEFSLAIEKLPELAGLIKGLISVLEVGCRNVVINNQETYLKITTFEDAAMASILKTFVEVTYFNLNNKSRNFLI